MSMIIDQWKETYDPATNNGLTTPSIYRGIGHTHPAPQFLADGVTPYPGRWSNPSSIAQSFRGGTVTLKLITARFWMRKSGNPSGMMRAVLYAHTGTYGDIASKPGTPLAYSESKDTSSITGSASWNEFTFLGLNQVMISANTPYFIALEAPPEGALFGDVNNDGTVENGMIQPYSEGSATPTANHPGIQVQFIGDNGPSWVIAGTNGPDLAFAVLGITTATANISGMVTDLTQGGAFNGALVELFDEDGAFTDSAYTDINGQYNFTGVTARPYTVRASAGPNYNTATTVIDASAGGSFANVNLALDVVAPYTVWGYVKYPNGGSVPNLQMNLIPYTPPAPVYTDAVTGQYTFTDVPRQNYRLQFATPVEGYYAIDDEIMAPDIAYNSLRHDVILRPIVPGVVPEPPDGQCYHTVDVLLNAAGFVDAGGIKADLELFLGMIGKERCYALENSASGDIQQNVFPALFMPDSSYYATQSFKPILDAGLARAVIVVMNPFDQTGAIDTVTVQNAIINGDYDTTWLLPRVNQCKNFKDQTGNLYPIVIRLNPEFNQNWIAALVGKGGKAGSPSTFIAMWKHIVNYFRDNGVTNVSWQWSVGWNDANLEIGTFRDYYPGDDYVDWTGIDAYWMGSSDVMESEINEVYNWLYNDAAGPHSTRPCSLAEWGYKNNVVSPWGNSSDEYATAYISGAFYTFESHQKIKLIRLHWAASDAAGSGFIFQNFDNTKPGYFPGAVAVYTSRVANPRYLEFEPGVTTVNLTIDVNDLTMGTTDPMPETYEITQGSNVQVSAIPQAGYMFDHWELDGVNVGSSSPYSVLMDTDHSILAVFVAKPPPPPGKQHLTISSTTGGTTTPAAGVWEYDEGSTAQVTATPNTGYLFKHWLFDNVIAGTDPTITVAMDADHTLLAVFEAVPPTPRLWTWPFLTWLNNFVRQRRGLLT